MQSFLITIFLLFIGIIVVSLAYIKPKKITDEKGQYHLEKDDVDKMLDDVFFNFRQGQKLQ